MFFHFWPWLLGFFSTLFPEATASCDKKNFEIIITALYFTQTRGINIFVLRGVFFSRYVKL